MKPTMKIEGLEELERALADKVKAAGGEMSEKFVTLSMQAISAQTMPFIPVDTSALINSEVRQSRSTSHGWEGVIGYGDDSKASGALGTPVSEYAIYVHEGPQKNWQKPGASNKFLEKGVKAFVNEDADGLIRFAFKGLSDG